MIICGACAASSYAREPDPASLAGRPGHIAERSSRGERSIWKASEYNSDPPALGRRVALDDLDSPLSAEHELIALCKPLAARRLAYATHMRNEDDRLIEAIDESIAVARGAGCPLQISHLKTQGPRNWSKLDTAFTRIAAARKAGSGKAADAEGEGLLMRDCPLAPRLSDAGG